MCEQLKAIRQQVADKCGVDYTPTPCDYEGDCPGTCPQCDREGALLLLELEMQMDKNPDLLDDIRLSPEIVEALIGKKKNVFPDGDMSARELSEHRRDTFILQGLIVDDPTQESEEEEPDDEPRFLGSITSKGWDEKQKDWLQDILDDVDE